MVSNIKVLSTIFLMLATLHCTTKVQEEKENIAITSLQSFPVFIKRTIPKKKTGILEFASPLKRVYTKSDISNFTLPFIDENLAYGLQQNLALLKAKNTKKQKFDGLTLNISDLETTNELLLLWKNTFPQGLHTHLNAYQLSGKDGKGNVYFTGYFTPELQVSEEPSAQYPYPIYAYPKDWKKGALPTRIEIDGQGALSGMGLELAYTNRLEDIYSMQMQGSGLVSYPDGKREYFAFAGTNKHSSARINTDTETLLKNLSVDGVKHFLTTNSTVVAPALFANPSYVFFKPTKILPQGAGFVPLTGDFSVAVDPKIIPLGSCLLAAIPILDKNGLFSHHEYRFVLAQDVGGKIKGSGHLDVYCGSGEEGKKKAMAFHHYGQLWLLAPKPSNELGPVVNFKNKL